MKFKMIHASLNYVLQFYRLFFKNEVNAFPWNIAFSVDFTQHSPQHSVSVFFSGDQQMIDIYVFGYTFKCNNQHFLLKIF